MADELDTPAARLTGMKLPDGWVVEELLAVGRANSSNDSTGGTFSVSYRVRRDNSVAFLKALDLDSVIRNDGEGNFLEGMTRATTAFGHEQQLNNHCADKRMRQVVSIISHGDVMIERKPHDYMPRVSYMILELADGGDVRSYIRQSALNDYAAKFGYLKDVLLGIGQLHGEAISHQDLKPSNVMVFKKLGAKVGDLGRATVKGFGHGAFEQESVAGDYSYAPPEQLYGFIPTEWMDRRERSDLYQFGSLVSFLLFGITLNALIKDRIPAAIGPKHWFPDEGGQSNYSQALPFLQSAFFDGLHACRPSLPDWAADKVIDLIVDCANPDYSKRGARKLLGKGEHLGLGLNRFVSTLENLRTEASKQAILDAKRPKSS